jgi:hypothetical protein
MSVAALEGQPMSPVRKMIVLVVATVMIAGGCWLLYEQWTVSTSDEYVVAMSVGGGLLIAVGIMLLWEDFIAPLIARKPS